MEMGEIRWRSGFRGREVSEKSVSNRHSFAAGEKEASEGPREQWAPPSLEVCSK